MCSSDLFVSGNNVGTCWAVEKHRVVTCNHNLGEGKDHYIVAGKIRIQCCVVMRDAKKDYAILVCAVKLKPLKVSDEEPSIAIVGEGTADNDVKIRKRIQILMTIKAPLGSSGSPVLDGGKVTGMIIGNYKDQGVILHVSAINRKEIKFKRTEKQEAARDAARDAASK